MSWMSSSPAKAGLNKKNVRIANTATGGKLAESMKIIFITHKNDKKKYLGLVSVVYNTEKNKNKIGREFIPYPENLDQLSYWEDEGCIFPLDIKNKFLS